MPPSTDDLEAADDEVWAALRHGDADALEAIADADITVSLPAFEVDDFDQLLRALQTGSLEVDEVDVERRRLRIAGELATTVAVATVTGTRGGAPFRTRLRWVRTWRLSAAWVLLAASSSPIRESAG